VRKARRDQLLQCLTFDLETLTQTCYVNDLGRNRTEAKKISD